MCGRHVLLLEVEHDPRPIDPHIVGSGRPDWRPSAWAPFASGNRGSPSAGCGGAVVPPTVPRLRLIELLRLITNSYLVGTLTGKSPGLAKH